MSALTPFLEVKKYFLEIVNMVALNELCLSSLKVSTYYHALILLITSRILKRKKKM